MEYPFDKGWSPLASTGSSSKHNQDVYKSRHLALLCYSKIEVKLVYLMHDVAFNKKTVRWKNMFQQDCINKKVEETLWLLK